MPIANNISITKSAEEVLGQQFRGLRLSGGAVAAMIFIEYFTEKGGSSVSGFVPGYQLGIWPYKSITADWLLARLPGGLQFYLLPKIDWSPQKRYLLDNAGGSYALFSLRAN